MTNRIPVGVFFALFTVSGFAGLIYQSIWSHYLKLFLGHAAYAQTLVLAIFMGGMAIGSWLVSRYTAPHPRPAARLRDRRAGHRAARDRLPPRLPRRHRLGVRHRAAGARRLGRRRPLQVDARLAADPAGLDPARHHLPADERGHHAPLPGRGRPGAVDAVLHQQLRRRRRRAGERLLPHRPARACPGTILTAGLAQRRARLRRVADHQAPARRGAAPVAPRPRPARGRSGARLRARSCSSPSSPARPRSSTRSPGSACSRSGSGASTHSFEVMLAAFILAMSLGAFWFCATASTACATTLRWLAGLLVAKALFAVVRGLDLRRRARLHAVDDDGDGAHRRRLCAHHASPGSSPRCW